MTPRESLLDILNGNAVLARTLRHLPDSWMFAYEFAEIRLDNWKWSLEDILAICPGGKIPAACDIHLSLKGNSSTEFRGIAVLLDANRRWWVSGILCVDGTPTAVIQRFGREGCDSGRNLLLPKREREWRRFQSMKLDWEVLRGDSRLPAVLFGSRDEAPLEDNLYVPKGCDPISEAFKAAQRECWEGWTAAQAVAAHTLGLTRYGMGLWL